MSSIPTMDGIDAQTVTSSRLTTRVLFSGPDDATPVLFAHGNLSSATYWEETMLSLPDGFRGIAPDQRGYGDADPAKKIDATRGMGDWADDFAALMDHLNIEKAHVVGHSAGGSMLWRFLMDYPDRVLTATLVDPGSPFGFGGSKPDGSPIYEDGAGSGAGIVNPELVKLLAAKDRGTDSQVSPRNTMNAFYWKPPFKPAREEELLSSMLSVHVGSDSYPGDAEPSSNWPGAAPGKFGLNNALAPTHVKDIQHLYSVDPKPYVLWIRGAEDQIVADASFFEMGTLGQAGAVPGYPGVEAYPPQPMVTQTRNVLNQYAAQGGQYDEVVISDAGHSPFIEKLTEFNGAFHQALMR